MYTTIISCGFRGIHSYIVKVEVDVSQGLPGFEMVGYLGSEVKEARERVKVALKNSGILLPPAKITVNISPADIRKDGTAYDLPIAIGILKCLGYFEEDETTGYCILGELGLNGEVRPVRGVLPMTLYAAEHGVSKVIVPDSNLSEAAVVQSVSAYGVSHISELIAFFQGERNRLSTSKVSLKDVLCKPIKTEYDFNNICGQNLIKKAAEISASGFHHLLMIGPPGSGKTMIAKCIRSILPKLSELECLEVSSIYSVAGMLGENQYLITERPFLNPHHTISEHALAGGGLVPRPGVISLSHRGVLFLDELTEFKKNTLEILRQPLEDQKVQISRSSGTYTYPAGCLIVAAMNPCPCGYYPDTEKCHCKDFEIDRYLGKISGPILDRMDLITEVQKVEFYQLGNQEQCWESSADIRERVERARMIQKKRYEGTNIQFNGDINANEIRKYCKLGLKEQTMLEKVYENMGLSARTYHKLIKVARTIADLEGSNDITTSHLSQAICFRAGFETYWNNRGGIYDR